MLALCLVYEDTAIENTENYCCQQPHCRLRPPIQRTPANIRINLILPETRVIGYIFATDSIDLSPFKVSW